MSQIQATQIFIFNIYLYNLVESVLCVISIYKSGNVSDVGGPLYVCGERVTQAGTEGGYI